MNYAQRQYFIQILSKYRLGTATTEEIKFLETYYNTFELNEDLITSENEDDYLFLKEQIKDIIDVQIGPYQKKSIDMVARPMWQKYLAAASVLIFLSIAAFFFVPKSAKKQMAANAYKGIVPGGNKAMLTLASGKKIILDGAAQGEIAQQAGVRITKTADGQIVYNVLADDKNTAAGLQNTITTPRGGQYKVILPDGTKVWLNAASSLSYPASFHGEERLVTLNGEAYFEVARNPDMPFKVKSDLQTIEVLGTHFNVNAYADESALQTTLLEGSVKIVSGKNSGIIVPGEKAVINRNGNGTIITRKANLDKETAWKNGVFSFDNDDIKSVMRQVCRWYDINVVYADNLPSEKYFGEIPRNSNLAGVFEILELNNVKFDVEGKTVKVSYNKP
ncbi:FecR family protein [Mucilaginibacter paludis]|uniref:Anti-FecI sigma factor, FecR n=1 Tax=Mucilaginibacter paludis DSM 18603 TaxID=714943 RepID=H1Y2L2_9SPHI|nr:FecR family protein [Mucilaginibacter paludis]EHQ28060.1 anti-FecI sigma factor, FecR [Mucilaginibacter paludis DSM 18603]